MEIYGKNAVETALNNNYKINKIYLELKRYKNIVELAKQKNIKCFDIREYGGEIVPGMQGIIAYATDIRLLTFEEILEKTKDKENAVLIISDKITDPQNLGAIIRNMVAFKADGLLIPKFNNSPITGTVIKASAGTALFANIAEVSSLTNVILKLKDKGFWVVSTVMDGKHTLKDIQNINATIAIILGSEGDGVSKTFVEKSDFHLSIPMDPKVESLNVASTSAIILHALSSK